MSVISKRAKWPTHTIRWPDGSDVAIIPLRHENDGVFVVGRTPVTNSQYRAFVRATAHHAPQGEAFEARNGLWAGPFDPWADEAFNAPDQPVVCVSYEDALSYCNWVSAHLTHGRAFLPTVELWIYAALADVTKKRPGTFWRDMQATLHPKAMSPASIDEAKARTNPWGLVDMFGNVWEWCREIYSEVFRLGPPRIAALQGGGFLDDLLGPFKPFLYATELEQGLSTKHTDLGFRVAGVIPLAAVPKSASRAVGRAPRGEVRWYEG
jgi:hypothetical protein